MIITIKKKDDLKIMKKEKEKKERCEIRQKFTCFS
jgi:hypothetical protein